MQRAQSATIAEASAAAGTGAFVPFPASVRTGAARRTFIPAYSGQPPARLAAGGTGADAPAPPAARTKTTMTGTSNALSAEIPFIPRDKKAATSAPPPRESSGLAGGYSASSPASIAAEGIKHAAAHNAWTAVAPRPKTARTAARYPPYFFPTLRKKDAAGKNAANEKNTAAENPSAGKKRTSSAPDTNPAPITVPTISKVSLISSIVPLYALFWKFMTFFAQKR